VTQDVPKIILELAQHVGKMAAARVAPDGFPPFGMIFGPEGALRTDLTFHIDTGDVDQVNGAFDETQDEASAGGWYAFGCDATVQGQGAVVLFLGVHGNSNVAKFILHYAFEDGRVTIAPSPRFGGYVDRPHS